jgi:hypothetical protein
MRSSFPALPGGAASCRVALEVGPKAWPNGQSTFVKEMMIAIEVNK